MYKGLTITILAAMLLIGGCTAVVHPGPPGPNPGRHRPHPDKIWVPGHYTPHGEWVPGHWIIP